MKLNLDALKKQLTGAKGLAPRMEQPKPPPAAPTPAGTPTPLIKEKVEPAPAAAPGLKFIPLGRPREPQQKVPTVKLVPLSELKKRTEPHPPAAPGAEQPAPEPPVVVVQPAESLFPAPPAVQETVFKNLSRDSNIAREEEKDEYKKYRRRKIQKVLVYSSYPIAAVFVLAVAATTIWTPLQQQSSYKVAIPQQEGQQQKPSTNQNINAPGGVPRNENLNIATPPPSHPTPSQPPVAGEKVATAFRQVFPSLNPEQQATIDTLYSGQREVIGMNVIKGIMTALNITMLYPTSEKAERYESYWSQQHHLLTEEELNQPIGDQQLTSVLQKAATIIAPNNTPAPSEQVNSQSPLSGNEFISFTLGDFKTISEENQTRLIDTFAGKPAVQVGESLSFLWNLFHLILPENDPLYLTHLAIEKGIVPNAAQMNEPLTNEELYNIAKLIQSHLPPNP